VAGYHAPPVAQSLRRHVGVVSAVAGFVLLAAFVAFRVLVFEMMRIPQLGMAPTYGPGAYVFVNKWRPRPRRGDVVVFDWPEDPTKRFVQRVIGMPGDALDTRGGHPAINGWPVPSCEIGHAQLGDRDGRLVVEFLEGRAYLAFYEEHPTKPPPEHPVRAKPGEYLMLGDNRLASYDSRAWFGGKGGGVPRELVVGIPFSAPPLDVPSDLRAALDACIRAQPPPTLATPPAPDAVDR
jgi:signal peptidase I